MSIAYISRAHIKCHGCGMPVMADMLDAKPFAYATPAQVVAAADTGAAFDRLECQTCYGPGWRAVQ